LDGAAELYTTVVRQRLTRTCISSSFRRLKKVASLYARQFTLENTGIGNHTREVLEYPIIDMDLLFAAHVENSARLNIGTIQICGVDAPLSSRAGLLYAAITWHAIDFRTTGLTIVAFLTSSLFNHHLFVSPERVLYSALDGLDERKDRFVKPIMFLLSACTQRIVTIGTWIHTMKNESTGDVHIFRAYAVTMPFKGGISETCLFGSRIWLEAYLKLTRVEILKCLIRIKVEIAA
jgi:hypothetical protein